MPKTQDAPQHRTSPVGVDQRSAPLTERVYSNDGNPEVIDQVDPRFVRVLDIGCGAGDNAALLKRKNPAHQVFGITRSESEASRARQWMSECWVGDIEKDLPESLRDQTFDCILFSHVLEHLRDPAALVARTSQLLRPGGRVVIAIPNVMFFKMRLQFLRGDFRYHPEGGILDDTHLHFYTFFTADEYLLSASPELQLIYKGVSGYFPMPVIRGRLVPRRMAEAIDSWSTRRWPNLFGFQIILAAEKRMIER